MVPSRFRKTLREQMAFNLRHCLLTMAALACIPMSALAEPAALVLPLPAVAPATSPAPAAAVGGASPETLALKKDLAARLTVPVMLEGLGPFPFVIDTGADRTVISRELADQLKLTRGPRAVVRGTANELEVDTAVIRRLTVGGRTLRNINAPLLASTDLGAVGMLGVDTLADQHIVLDFKSRTLSTSPSKRDDNEPGTIVVRGKYRFGQLILVDARIRDVFVYVILDTGAESSIGNPVLRRMLTTSNRKDDPLLSTQIISVTGQSTPAEFQTVKELTLGPLTIRNVPMAFATLHTFDIFGLNDKPALLLGMDILSHFRRVAVDFKRREVTFNVD